ncbi:hypothetical protein OCV66_08915 [Agathobaculum ammoniilyticum]|uniref:Uncharacterized protein n=1 Tax=Agathobaculum ammoniilyticum TaxID=2981778 RepID=A0ABT2U3K9_9FIRM|nr:hypothetical protein [Agathobaculum ammoniilyticum]
MLNNNQYTVSQLRLAVDSILAQTLLGAFTLGDLQVTEEFGGAFQEIMQEVSQGSFGERFWR